MTEIKDRQVFLVEENGDELPVWMIELRDGDRFKIRMSDPEDHPYELGETIYFAVGDAYFHPQSDEVTVETVVPGLYWWHRTSDETGMSGVGRVGQVAVFEDGSAVLRWLSERNYVGVSSFAVYRSIRDLLNVHGHGDRKTGHLEPVADRPTS